MENNTLEVILFFKNTMSTFFESIANNIDLKSIITEFFKTIFAALLGFLTFKIYQGYKNKKENHLLYIHLLKLEKEAHTFLDELKSVSAEHDEMNRLEMEFNLKETHIIYLFYSKIVALSVFVNQVPIYNQRGEIVDVEYEYGEYAYSEISRLEDCIQSVEEEDERNEEYLDDLYAQLSSLRKSSLIGELERLLSKKEVILNKGIFIKSLEYFFSEIAKFIENNEQNNPQDLDEFCKRLFDQNNNFSATLDKYKRLSTLKRKLTKPVIRGKVSKKITSNFVLWSKEETELLAIYDIESFLKLEEIYESNKKLEIYIWDKCMVDTSIKNIEVKMLNALQEVLTILKKTVIRTNKLFKGV